MMTFPTLGEIAERARQSFRAYLPGSDAWIWPNNLYATAKVIAGAVSEVYGRLDYVQRQKFATTADGEWLDLHGSEIGVPRLPAAQAAGFVTFTSVAALTVASGAALVRADGARVLVTQGGSLLGVGTLSLPAVAEVAGKAGTTIEGTSLSVVSGVTGAATVAVDPGGLSGGADIEDDESFRSRILFRKANPPHGGAPADYVMWARRVPGVTRVFVERIWGGPGTVRVFPLTDDATTGGVPTPAVVQAVRDILAVEAPAAAIVTTAGAIAYPIDVTITGLFPDNATVRAAILAELQDTFTRKGRVAGVDTPNAAMPYLATPQTFSRSWITQAIANAVGEERHIVTQPSADQIVPQARVPKLGTLSFVT